MITLSAPAKINLFLRVINKREDGYHEIASLFQTLDFSDILKLQLDTHDTFTCTDPSLENTDNLCMKALKVFREKYVEPFFVKTHLIKYIPIQAGLGGGSSDAAAMLKGLNELLKHPFDKDELGEMAEKIGSDVPFFMQGGAAYCTGRGEQIKRLSSFEPENISIIKPSFGLSTAVVYDQIDFSKLQTRDPKVSLQDHLFGKGEYYNDLEEAAFSVQPALKEIKTNLLSQGFEHVLLAGSGSSLICFGKGDVATPPDCTLIQTKFK